MAHDDTASPPLLQAASHPDPYPFYAALPARRGALFFDEADRCWVACTPAAVQAVLDCRALAVRPADEPVPRALVGRPSGRVFGGLMRMNEGEALHGAPKARAPARLAALEAGLPAAAQAVANAGLRPGAQPINELLVDAPLATLAALCGVPGDDRLRVARQVRALVTSWTPTAGEPERSAGDQAADALLARFDGDANRVGFFTQACDACAGLLGNTLVARQRGRDGPAAALVAEVALADPAVHHTRRFAHEAVTLLGQQIAPGDAVLVLLVAARRPYGEGRHACPGEALSQALVAALLTAWRPQAEVLRAHTAHWGYRALPNVRIPVFQERSA